MSGSEERVELNLVEVLRVLEAVDVILHESNNAEGAIDALDTLREQERILVEAIDCVQHDELKPEEYGTSLEQLQAILEKVRKYKQKVKNYVNALIREEASSKNHGGDKSNKEKDRREDETGVATPNGYAPLPFNQKEIPSTSAGAQSSKHQSGPPDIGDNEIIYDEEKDFIGEGSYGMVYRGNCRGKKVAIKVPKKKLNPRQMEQFRHEVAVMSKIFHPNIVLFMGAQTKGTIKIVTELCVTDVEKILRSDKPLSLYERMKMAKGACLGMNWLHGICKIIHRDLKPANLLIAEDGTVKVTDFGFGKYFETGKTFKGRAKGTPLWYDDFRPMAPEVMMGKETNEKRDVYSFGIILWEFLTRKEPFSEFKDWKAFKHAVCILNKRPTIPENCLPALRYLIERCWHADYRKRPSFSEIAFRINEVLVDCVIEDEAGREFWKKHFLADKPDLEESVKWAEFVKLATRLFDLKPEEEKKLKALEEFLCDKEEKTITETGPTVTMATFDRFIKWFGPFFMKERAAPIISATELLVKQKWFHGYVTSEEANSRLESKPYGSYLVRLSTTSPGKPYTLSILTSRTHIDHRRISYGGKADDKYMIRIDPHTYAFNSVVELIEKTKDVLGLKEPCPKESSAISNYL